MCLGGRLKNLNLDLAQPPGRVDLNAQPLGNRRGVIPVCNIFGAQIRIVLENGLHHRHPIKRTIKVEGIATVSDFCRTQNGLREFPHQLFREIHRVTEVGVGPVKLKHCELGVMASGQTLIAEVAIDLKDFLEPPYCKPLEIELGGHSQIHLHIQRVMVRDKGPCSRATCDRVEHWGLDLNKLPLDKKLPDELNRGRTHSKNLAHLRIHDEVNVSLPVTHFLIDEAVIFVR